jgi:hypothetical protein
LCGWKILCRCLFKPLGGLAVVYVDAFAVLIAQAYRILGYGITFFRLGYVV